MEFDSCWVPNGHYGPALYYKMSKQYNVFSFSFLIHSDNIVDLKKLQGETKYNSTITNDLKRNVKITEFV